ncbi:conjugal transfer protein TraX [Paenibacillus sp. A3]|uniref:TraX family protein n=1 Tax=Paenibacillus sp. A3 TaxID=1337054 RepID=UPI0006D59AF2|nr:TraX family protein [Paenibacillus sp. A3]KPV58228.1 conjugal transfer protein TraX [Paenibacillus sp. A3]
MQLIAMITMLADHIGAVFFEDQAIWRVIGRIAFPIYAYGIVMGYRHTRDLKSYMKRLLILAVLSQAPYMLALGKMGVNAVGTLLVCVAVLYVMEHRKKSVWLPVAVASVVVMEVLSFDYGLYGLLLVLIYHYTKSHAMVASHFILNVLFLALKGWLLGAYSIIATIGIAYAPALYGRLERRSVPGWLWRSFYPAHLAVLAMIEPIVALYR